MSADLGQIPTIWKTSTIISISKKSKELMEGRNFFKNIEGETDPLQFVYQPNENVEDAKLFYF